MKFIVLWLVPLFFVQCKNTFQNYSKNIETIVKTDNDTIISPLLEKYKSNIYIFCFYSMKTKSYKRK